MTQATCLGPANFLVTQLLSARIKRAASDSVDFRIKIEGHRLTIGGTAESYFACQIVEHAARQAMKSYGLTTFRSQMKVV